MSFEQKLSLFFSMLRVQIISYGKLRMFLMAIFLVAVLNGASAAFFLGVSTDDFFYETDSDTLIITDERATTPVTGRVSSTLCDLLNEVPGVMETSPETLSLCTLSSNNQPITVRGVTNDFRDIISLTMHAGVWLFGNEIQQSKEIVVGKTLSEKLGITVGQSILLSSSRISEVIPVKIVGIFETKRSFDEEFFTSLDLGQILGGLASSQVTVVRVKIDPLVTSKSEVRNFIKNLSAHTIVTGHIYDDSSHQPLAGVIVTVYQAGRLIAQNATNTTGSYIVNLLRGNYSLVFTLSTHHSFALSMLIDSGERIIQDVNLTRKQTFIEGFVFNSHLLSPIGESSVYLINSTDQSTLKQTYTNDSGYFRFNNIYLGYSYNISCEHSSYYQTESSFVEFLFTDQTNTRLDLFLAPNPSNLTIRLVASDTGQPLEGASLTLRNPSYENTTLSDAQGMATFVGLLGGNYSISITHPNYSAEYSNVFVDVESHQFLDMTISSFLVQGSYTLSGQIKGFEDQPISSAFLKLCFASNATTIASVFSSQNGAFEFAGIPNFSYRIEVFDLELNYFPKIVYFTFSGSQTEHIDVDLSPKPSDLKCFVRNQVNRVRIKNFHASIFFEDQPSPLMEVTSSFQYSFKDLQPGEYTVRVEREDYETANHIIDIPVNSKESITINLVPKNGSISGQVADKETESFMSSAWVQLLSSEGNVVDDQLTTSDGRYTFTDVVCGTYTLKVSASSLYAVQYVRDIEITPNQDISLSIIYLKRAEESFDPEVLDRAYQLNAEDLSYLSYDNEALEEILTMFENTFMAMIFLLIILSTLSVVSVVSQPIRESRNELTLLRVLGATSEQIALIIAIQLMLISLIATTLGTLLGGFLVSTIPFFQTVQIGFLLINPQVDLIIQVIIIVLMVSLIGFTSFNLVLIKQDGREGSLSLSRGNSLPQELD
ncbi:MAG: carboxypeptidase regulatory-like domain-containing protein [Candidatus Hodarchaeota archaeon]